MSENVIQTSFAAGEVAPSIFARTDLAIYHQGLGTCRNMFVDYRSGISSRPGSTYVLQCKKLGSKLLPFSVTTSVTYMVEFGDLYCRFYSNGAPVLESPFSISSITNSPTSSGNIPGNNFAIGDWIFLNNINGMPAMNGRFVLVVNVLGNIVTFADLQGGFIDTSTFGTYTSGGTASRVYTISSPYAAADLFPTATGPGLKIAQSVSVLYITHPNYPPTTLSFIAPTNWVFASIVFGTTIAAPGAPTVSVNGGTGAVTNYAYVVTAVDSSGQESIASTPGTAVGGNIATSAGSVTVTWGAVVGAVSYNIYKAEPNNNNPVPAGVAFGFVGTAS